MSAELVLGDSFEILFAGAGTTLVAAERLGRRSLGIDHDAAAIAEARRLTAQPLLFPAGAEA